MFALLCICCYVNILFIHVIYSYCLCNYINTVICILPEENHKSIPMYHKDHYMCGTDQEPIQLWMWSRLTCSIRTACGESQSELSAGEQASG
jgi:hypothetical protein